MTKISYRATYSGHVDGERVAWTYRAFNEEGAPYVLALKTEDGLSTIVQAPLEFLDGVADESSDLVNAQGWVHRLTELVQKARQLDILVDIVDSAIDTDDMAHDITLAVDEIRDHVGEEDEDWDDDEDDIVELSDYGPVPRPVEEYANPAFTVDELTDAEDDREWDDCDGDHYKHIDGVWYLSYGGRSPWLTADADELTDYGPYAALPR